MKSGKNQNQPDKTPDSSGLNRRDYLKVAGAAGVSGSLLTAANPLSTAQNTTTPGGNNTTSPGDAGGAEPFFAEGFENGTGLDRLTGGYKVPGQASHTTETAKSGTGSLRVDIPSGSHYGMAGLLDLADAGIADAPPQALYASFWVKFEAEFEHSHGFASKLPGFQNHERRPSGAAGTPSNGSNGWAARGLFSDGDSDGTVELGYYCYHMDQSGSYGDSLDATTVPTGEWHHIAQYIQLNTTSGGSANRDGQLTMWVNGERAFHRADMAFTNSPENGVNYAFQVYYGGNGTSPRDNTLFIDDWILAPGPTNAELGDTWTPEDYTGPGAGNRNPDTTTDDLNSLTLVDNQTQKDQIDSSTTEYEFSVTGSVSKTTAMDATKDDEDTIDNGTVTGQVNGDADSYTFTGTLASFSIDGDATIYLNEEQVSPNTLRQLNGNPNGNGTPVHRVSIDGTGASGPVDYSFTATSRLFSEADDDNDSIDGQTVTGTVAGDTDSYLFTGNLTELQIKGNATMTVERAALTTADISSGATGPEPTPDDATTLDISEGEDIAPYLEQISDGDVVALPTGSYTISSATVSADDWGFYGQAATVKPKGNPTLRMQGANWVFSGVRWDVSPSSNIKIQPSGGPWRVANCAWDGKNGSRQHLVNPQITNEGTEGIIEECWFGTGVASEGSGLWNESAIKGVYDVRGKFIVRGCYFYQNGGYISATASKAANTHTGSHHLENCYFENCYLSSARLGTPVGGTCTAKNSTFVFDGDYADVPATDSGVKRARGLWFYWNRGRVENCDLSFPNETAIATGKGGSVDLRNSEVVGHLSDVDTTNVGSNPDTSPPNGCVTSADEAVGQ